jgi:hypothetical protein
MVQYYETRLKLNDGSLHALECLTVPLPLNHSHKTMRSHIPHGAIAVFLMGYEY